MLPKYDIEKTTEKIENEIVFIDKILESSSKIIVRPRSHDGCLTDCIIM